MTLMLRRVAYPSFHPVVLRVLNMIVLFAYDGRFCGVVIVMLIRMIYNVAVAWAVCPTDSAEVSLKGIQTRVCTPLCGTETTANTHEQFLQITQ